MLLKWNKQFWWGSLCNLPPQILRDIQKVYEKKLLKAFFSNFPYSVQEGGTGRYQQNTPKMLVSVQEVNVLVCGVVSYLISPGQKQGWTFKLMKYVRNTLEGDGQLSTEHAQMLLIIVERLMRNVINKGIVTFSHLKFISSHVHTSQYRVFGAITVKYFDLSIKYFQVHKFPSTKYHSLSTALCYPSMEYHYSSWKIFSTSSF